MAAIPSPFQDDGCRLRQRRVSVELRLDVAADTPFTSMQRDPPAWTGERAADPLRQDAGGLAKH
jgi:hypothetical protein